MNCARCNEAEAVNVLNCVHFCGDCIDLVDICRDCRGVYLKTDLVDGRCPDDDAFFQMKAKQKGLSDE